MTKSIRKSRIIMASCTVVLALAFLTVFALLKTDRLSAQSPKPTEYEDVSYHVVLAQRIDIDIETNIDAEIAETKLWMRPHGEDKIPSYRYVEFTQTDNIRAAAEIDMRSPSYFPPGTIFDVRFEFVSEDGDVYTSKTYQVEHIDDAHDWQRLADSRLEIIYYGVADQSIRSLHARAAPLVPEISDALGVEEVPQFRAVIFPNVRELTIHGPTISQAATTGHYFGGYAYDEYNLTIMASPSASTLIHELTHLIFGRALNSPYARSAPGWLNEGNASYWETGNRSASLRNFAPIARAGRVNEFEAMNSVPGLRRDINDFYIQSTDFVGYLIENHGRDSIGSLLAELNAGKDINAAMRAVYGGSLSEIENGWRKEWGLPSISSNEVTVNIERVYPPTIPGLPKIETGTLNQMPASTPDSTIFEPTPTAVPIDPPEVIRVEPEIDGGETPEPQATPEPEPTTVVSSSEPTRPIYFVPGPDDEWPQVKPSAIIIFVLLALGVAAMMYRRVRNG